VFCAKFLGLPVLGVRILGIALRGEDNGQILVGQRIARIELNGLPVLGDRLRGLGANPRFLPGLAELGAIIGRRRRRSRRDF
jgi:hypothetical protein